MYFDSVVSNYLLVLAFFLSFLISVRYGSPETFSLRDNRMTDEPLGVVVSALERSSLLKLDLSENRVGESAMGKLCAFLEEDNCLEVSFVFGEVSGRLDNVCAFLEKDNSLGASFF